MKNQSSRSVSVGAPMFRKEVTKSAGLLVLIGVLTSVPRMVAGGAQWWVIAGAGMAFAAVLLALEFMSGRASHEAQGDCARRVAD